uniref:Putative secreted protein n=1 Tax=Anopheles darlingi TaxID=43151 RepID=A0A2M4D8N8_ANODA
MIWFIAIPLSTVPTSSLSIHFWLCCFSFCAPLLSQTDVFRAKQILTNRGSRKSSSISYAFLNGCFVFHPCDFISYGKFATRAVDCVLGECDETYFRLWFGLREIVLQLMHQTESLACSQVTLFREDQSMTIALIYKQGKRIQK